MKNNLKKKIMALGFALSLVACMVIPGSIAMARGHIDVEKDCSVRVNISDEWADLRTADFSIKLYKVASVDTNGKFTATTDFDSLSSDLDSVDSETTAEQWSEYAKKASELLETTEVAEYRTIEIEKGKGGLSDLKTGLYLVAAEEAKTIKYGYRFIPYLISVPNNIYATSGTGEDSWIYENIDISLKPEQYDLKGDLEITKTLNKYNKTLGVPLFVFDVEAYNELNEVVFSDVVSIAFNSAGTRSAIVKDIPAGSRVVVKEVYAGASYEVTSDDSIETEIIAEETANVSFTNDYNDNLIYGTGVVNHFEYDGIAWTWHQIEDNE